jgi:hypothetical protein
MAIAAAALTGSNQTVNNTSFSTASITPTANRLVLALIYNRVSAGTASAPTLSGNGLTWVEVDSVQTAAARRLTLFRAMGGSPSAGAVTIDCGGVTHIHCIWSIVEFSGVDTSGTNGSGAIVQSDAINGAAATSLTVTLAAFSDVLNATYGGFMYLANEAGTTGNGGAYTQIHQVNQAENTTSVISEYLLANDTSVDASWTSSVASYGVAVEIKDAVGTPAAATRAWVGPRGQWG